MSGGGYRATLFHLGALYRLNQLGLLPRLEYVSSVSGGSITSAYLAYKWKELQAHFNPCGICPDDDFHRIMVKPLLEFCQKPLDVLAFFGGIFRGGAANHFARLLDYWLLKDFKLAELPDRDTAPVFIFNSTCINSGTCIRFTRSVITDDTTVRIRADGYHLAHAVAASAAFPPVLSPMNLRYDPSGNLGHLICSKCSLAVEREEEPEHEQARRKKGRRSKSAVTGNPSNQCACGKKLAQFTDPLLDSERLQPARNRMSLTDGGIFDNVGLEALWQLDKHGSSRFWLSSDASGIFKPKHRIAWIGQIFRVIEIFNHESYSVRIRYFKTAKLKRKAPASPGAPSEARGVYWRISDCIPKWREGMSLARVPTRLCDFGIGTMRQLVNWGYLRSAYSISKWTNGLPPEQKDLFPHKPLAPPFPEAEFLFGPLERK